MEKKKLKKLVLNKDVISKLENVEMNQMRGGVETDWISCYPLGCYVDSDFRPPTRRNCNETRNSCYAMESCVPMNCYGAGSDHPGCGATIHFTECGGGYF